jgi:hypothetical protein
MFVAAGHCANLVDHRVQTLLRRVGVHGPFTYPAFSVTTLDVPAEKVESLINVADSGFSLPISEDLSVRALHQLHPRALRHVRVCQRS